MCPEVPGGNAWRCPEEIPGGARRNCPEEMPGGFFHFPPGTSRHARSKTDMSTLLEILTSFPDNRGQVLRVSRSGPIDFLRLRCDVMP